MRKEQKKKQTETIKQKLWFCGRYMQENLSTVASWGLCWLPGNFMITTRLPDVITPPKKVAVVKKKTQLVFFTLQSPTEKQGIICSLVRIFLPLDKAMPAFSLFSPPVLC